METKCGPRKTKPVVEKRQVEAGPRAEQAALLYARWQGLTDEPDAVRQATRQELDRLIGCGKR